MPLLQLQEMEKMKSKEYWQKRYMLIEGLNNTQGINVKADIDKAFRMAENNIQGEIEKWYSRIADNNGVSISKARQLLTNKELEEFKWDLADYIKYGEENNLNGKWIKELENASGRWHINRLEALKLRVQQKAEEAFGNEVDSIDNFARDAYMRGYYRTAYEIQKGLGLGWNVGVLDDAAIDEIIKKPWCPDGKNFSSRIWTRKAQMVDELHRELLRTTLLGEHPTKAIDRMLKYVDNSIGNARHAAGRLAMTEAAYFGSKGQQDSFNMLGVEEYEIVATLDNSTSKICREMDGKHFPMSEYKAGVTAPPFHPYCRTCTCPYFDDEFTEKDIRSARNEEGEVYHVPADMNYEDWKKKYVDKDINYDRFDITEKGTYSRINSNGDLDVYLKRIEHEYATQQLTVRESEHLWDKKVGYIQSQGYADINEYMRGLKPKLDNPQRRFTVNILKRLTNNNALAENYIGVRRVDAGYLENVLNINTQNLLKVGMRKDGMGRLRTQLIPKDKQSAQKISDVINTLVGTSKGTVTDKAFTSVSLDESLNYFSHYPIKFEIQMEQGTKGLITSNLRESEFIIKDNSNIEIIGSKVYNDGGDNCILVFAKVKQ